MPIGGADLHKFFNLSQTVRQGHHAMLEWNMNRYTALKALGVYRSDDLWDNNGTNQYNA